MMSSASIKFVSDDVYVKIFVNHTDKEFMRIVVSRCSSLYNECTFIEDVEIRNNPDSRMPKSDPEFLYWPLIIEFDCLDETANVDDAVGFVGNLLKELWRNDI